MNNRGATEPAPCSEIATTDDHHPPSLSIEIINKIKRQAFVYRMSGLTVFSTRRANRKFIQYTIRIASAVLSSCLGLHPSGRGGAKEMISVINQGCPKSHHNGTIRFVFMRMGSYLTWHPAQASKRMKEALMVL